MLYAAVTHTGHSLSSGHYVSYVLAPSPTPLSSDSTNSDSTPRPHHAAKALRFDSTLPPDSTEPITPEIAHKPGCTSRQFGTPLNPRLLSSPQQPSVKLPKSSSSSDGYVWYECNDEHVTMLDCMDVDQMLQSDGSTPYLLFYKQYSV